MPSSAQISTRFAPDEADDIDAMLPERLLSGYELEGLVRTLARQQATAVRQRANDGALLYEICERWAIAILRNDPNITVVDDSFSFEIALKDPTITTVLVMRGDRSAIDDETLQRFFRRAPRSKTIFIDCSEVQA